MFAKWTKIEGTSDSQYIYILIIKKSTKIIFNRAKPDKFDWN